MSNWGYHLSVDCAGCSDSIKREDRLVAFAKDMVRALEMRAYGEPLVVMFGEDPRSTGYTLVQLIETSNITGHFCDYSGEAYIDIFSCKQFAPETALDVIVRYFAPQDYKSAFTERQAPQLEKMVAASVAGRAPEMAGPSLDQGRTPKPVTQIPE